MRTFNMMLMFSSPSSCTSSWSVLTNWGPFSLHVVWNRAYIVMSRQFVGGISVREIVVGAVLTGEAWEDELLRLAARFNASCLLHRG